MLLLLSFPSEKNAVGIFGHSFHPNGTSFHTVHLCMMIHESSGASPAPSTVLCLDRTVITKRKCMEHSRRRWHGTKNVYPVDSAVAHTDPCLKYYWRHSNDRYPECSSLSLYGKNKGSSKCVLSSWISKHREVAGNKNDGKDWKILRSLRGAALGSFEVAMDFHRFSQELWEVAWGSEMMNGCLGIWTQTAWLRRVSDTSTLMVFRGIPSV